MKTDKEYKTNYVFVGILTAALFVIQYTFSLSGRVVSKLFDYSFIDKDNLFMQISVHHIIQMVCAIILIFILCKFGKINGFKMQPEYDTKGIRYTIIFCSLITAYYLVIYIIGSITHTINTYDYELNTTNITGTLGFQILLSGTSEEILFRALPIAVYIHYMRVDSKSNYAVAIILSAFLFALAHINFREFIIPWFQVCYAFVLGLAYGYVFIKSKSVIYPMIMHSMSNVISVGGCYLYMLILNNF